MEIKRKYTTIFREGHNPEIHLSDCNHLKKEFFPVQKRVVAKSAKFVKKWMIENYAEEDYRIMNCTKGGEK